MKLDHGFDSNKSSDSVPPSPLILALSRWAEELKEDFERDFLLTGISQGFRITSADSHFVSVDCKNYLSATCVENFSKVESQIRTELELGRYIQVAEKPVIISSIGAVPKSDPNKIRLT